MLSAFIESSFRLSLSFDQYPKDASRSGRSRMLVVMVNVRHEDVKVDVKWPMMYETPQPLVHVLELS